MNIRELSVRFNLLETDIVARLNQLVRLHGTAAPGSETQSITGVPGITPEDAPFTITEVQHDYFIKEDGHKVGFRGTPLNELIFVALSIEEHFDKLPASQVDSQASAQAATENSNELSQAKFVLQVKLAGGESLEVYRGESGGVFGIDSSYLEQVQSEPEDPVYEPFDGRPILLID